MNVFSFQHFRNSPPDCSAVRCLELEDHGEQGGVYVPRIEPVFCCVHMYRVNVLPDAGEDEGDDGEAGHAPHHAHLHVQEPGRELSPLRGPELQAAIPLKFRCRGQI